MENMSEQTTLEGVKIVLQEYKLYALASDVADLEHENVKLNKALIKIASGDISLDKVREFAYKIVS
jgi:hypothetical protein